MKKFISRIQNLSERARELQQTLQSAPPKFAELREAVALTTGQFKQLKSDVEMGLADLKADNETHLLDSLLEINASVPVFQQAGYDLGGVDMELSPVQRLIVHLNRREDVPASTLRSLLASSQHRKVTQALIKSLIQAEEMADRVDLTNLVYYKLLVNVGPIPSVRLCWCPEDEALVAGHLPAVQPAVSASPAKSNSLGSYGKSSFFEPQVEAQPGVKPEEVPVVESAEKPVESITAPSPATPTAAEAASPVASAEPKSRLSGSQDWGKASLERFKKMPGVSKYRR
jgi:hypothetical protein